MAKTALTKEIEKALIREFRKEYGCLEVTIGIGTTINGRVDYMSVNSKNMIKMFEIKVSKSDFKSSAKKTFMGHYNYYAIPYSLYYEVMEEIPDYIGVYCYHETRKHLYCERKAKKQKIDSKMEEEIRLSLIRSLSRDCNKLYAQEDESQLELHKRLLKDEIRNSQYYQDKWTSLHEKLFFLLGRDWENKIDEMYQRIRNVVNYKNYKKVLNGRKSFCELDLCCDLEKAKETDEINKNDENDTLKEN